MKIFLSGWQATNGTRELEVIKSGYMRDRCFSFASVYKIPGLPYHVPGSVKALDQCVKHGIHIMMDSGVFGWRSYREACIRKKDEKALAKLCGEDEFIDTYVKYVKKNHKKWHFYVTIDLEKIAGDNFERHKKILAMGIKPVPVFHGDDSTIFIKKYADLGHDLIAIGSPKTRHTPEEFKTYFYNAFEMAARYNVGLHGLAFTSPWAMMEFPWYSVDSSSWSRVAGFGSIMLFQEERHRLINVNISTNQTTTKNHIKLNHEVMAELKERIDSDGFSFEQLREDFVQRHIFNARAMLELADYSTKRHGVVEKKFSLLLCQ